MPRPRHCRYVEGTPQADYYKPRGIPLSVLEEVQLSVEGLEAIRLADLEGLCAAEAAERMKISRFTFGRVLANARKAVAEALTAGKALHITGGNYEVLPPERALSGEAMPEEALSEETMPEETLLGDLPAASDMQKEAPVPSAAPRQGRCCKRYT